MHRADNKDPFSDPNNEDATFLRSLYHHLQKVPNPRKMDVQLAICNFTGVCVRAAMSGDPMPPVITPLQRPFHSEQAPPPSFNQQYHPGIIPHHHRAPATTAQNFGPPSQALTYESSSSQATSYSSQSSNPYSTTPSPYYQDL